MKQAKMTRDQYYIAFMTGFVFGVVGALLALIL